MTNGYTVIVAPDRATVVFLWVEGDTPESAARFALTTGAAQGGKDIVEPYVIAVLAGWVQPLLTRGTAERVYLRGPSTESLNEPCH